MKAAPVETASVRGLLLAVLLVPTASGVTVDLAAPEAVPLGSGSLAVQVTVGDAEGSVELKAWLGGEDWQASRTWNGTDFQRSDRYALTVESSAEGSWEGRMWLAVNADSTNADRLRESDEIVLGLRARTPEERAQVLAHRPPLAAEAGAWAAPKPGQPVAIREGETTLARVGSPEDPRPIRVPAPATGLEVCRNPDCEPALPWRLDRVGADSIEFIRKAVGPTEGGVVVAAGEACALPAQAPSGPRWRLHVAELAAGDRCRAVAEDRWAVRLWTEGREVGRAPDRPGRGEVVWDDTRQRWAPWRLPAGVEPRPAEARDVEGWIEAFATRERGLAVLEQVLENARERVTLSTYLFTSQPAAQLLAETAGRGIDVQLWLEPDPVGGTPEETRRLVGWLRERGVVVHEVEEPSQAGLLHAKVLVVDSSLVLVATENLTDHGFPTGGEGNLGLGVGIANASLARRVEATFREPGESRPLRPAGWAPFSAPVTLLTAPENAWRTSAVPAWIQASPGPVQGAVLRANPHWGPSPNPWLEAMVNKSRQAPVDVLLSGVPEGAAHSNRETVAHLRAHPRAGDLDARLSDPRGGTVHAKAIATPEAALVGSSNWGMGGALLNREVNLLVHDEEVAQEVARILDEGPLVEAERSPLVDAAPVPLAAWVTLAAAAGAAAARRGVSSTGARPRERSRPR